MFKLGFSIFSLLTVVGFTALVITIITLIKKYFPSLILKYKPNKRFDKAWIFTAELLLFFTLLSISISYLSRRNSVVALALTGVLLIAIYYLCTYYLKDYLTGLLIKSSGQYKIGDMIVTETYKGKISRLGSTQICINNDEGQNVYIPYSWIRTKLKAIQQSTDKVNSYSFKIEIEKSLLNSNTTKYIKQLVAQTPWVHPNIETEVEPLETKDNHKIFKVTVYTLSKVYHEKIEQRIIQYFSPSESVN